MQEDAGLEDMSKQGSKNEQGNCGYPKIVFHEMIYQEDQCGGNLTLTRSGRDPGYQAWYVKNYCTQHAISEFTQYFPYILLFLPVVLVGIERFFSRLFSANSQIEGLSALLREDFKTDKIKKNKYTARSAQVEPPRDLGSKSG